MATKDMAKRLIDSLPSDASLDDIIHALYIKAKFEKGIEEIKSGRGISHAEVKRRLKKWLK